MSYRLIADEHVESGIQRIALEQIDKARRDLAAGDRIQAVHQLRTRCKKIRATLRLVKPALGDRYRTENRRFRDIARQVADIRDAHVLVETFDKVTANLDERTARKEHASIRSTLIARREAALGLDTACRLERIDRALADASRSVAAWSLNSNEFAALLEGLGQTYMRARKSMRSARKMPTAIAHHQWRKRAKYHRHQCALLRDLRKSPMKKRIKKLNRLSDLLGEAHDLAVLEAALTTPNAGFGAAEDEKALIQLMARRRRRLQSRAHAHGKYLFAETPTALRHRFEAYWKAWRV